VIVSPDGTSNEGLGEEVPDDGCIRRLSSEGESLGGGGE